jgi:hypothetical protein
MMWRRSRQISDEELDWAIRGALLAETKNLEPSPEVWNRIRAQVVAERNPKLPPAKKSLLTRPMAALVQGIAVLTVLCAVGLGLDQGVNRGWIAAQPTPAPVVRSVYPDTTSRPPWDVLSVGRARAFAQRPVPGEWRYPE